YAAAARYCTLHVNGDYRGIYRLVERPKRDGNRIDIKADGGVGASFVIRQGTGGPLYLVLRQLSSEPTESDLLRHASNRQCLSQHKNNRKSRGKQKPFDGFDANPHCAVGGHRNRSKLGCRGTIGAMKRNGN